MSSYKHSESSKYSETSKRLIKSLTNFDENDENFLICHDFVLSTLLYHNYRDANSHEVMHKISRLHEKYLIQSDLEKAKVFKRITDNLINHFNDKGISEKEKGYRVLSLILLLCESGNSNNLLPDTQNLTHGIKESSNFDWSSYLKEDDINCNVYVDSDSEIFTPDASTEEAVSSEEDYLENLPDPLLRPPPRDDSGLGISPDSCSGTSQLFHAATALVHEPVPCSAKAEKNAATFYPYWLEKYQKMYGASPYDLKTMNFTKIWNEYLASHHLSALIDKKVILHERNVIKEIIWMFSGVQDLFVVQWDGSIFIPNSKVHLCNLTSNTLGQMLNEFSTYATKKSILHNHSKIYAHDCLTFQAYRESFREELWFINDSLCDIDKVLRKSSDTFTLMILQRKMKPIFYQIDILYQIYKEVSPELSKEGETFVKACNLLQTLWKLLLNQSIQDQTSKALKTVLRMFLKTCKPYFKFLEDLTILGSFKDLHSEFIIRKRDVTTDDEIYWDMSMVLRSSREIEENFFMKPFLTDILSAGKSLEILNKIKSSLKVEAFRLHAEQGDLYLKFIQILQRYICPKSNWLIVSKEAKRRLQEDGTNLELIGQNDPLLEQEIFPLTSSSSKFFQPDINPAYKLVSQKPFVNIFTLQQELTQKIIQMLEPNSLRPLTGSIIKALSICMQIAYNPVCRQLMKSFKEDYAIMRHMSVMRKYFLMESGDLMYSFYSEIFWKIFNKQPWKDISFLYSALQNAIFEDKSNCRKLYVFLNDQAYNPQKPLNYLSVFQLSYQVKWPITMMLGKSVQTEYSQIFTFLLQIKCAKFLLDNLYSQSLCKQGKKTRLMQAFLRTTLPREQKMHGMYIIRMRLMFFVNGLHNYIMTRILHSFGIEFHDSLEKAQTVEEMIGIHKSYLKSLHERCLLDRRISYIKDYIFQVLNLCYIFQQLWLKGVDDVSVEELINVEKQFSDVSNILICCFTKPLRRGTYLHLESLVSTMLSNSHSMHIFRDENL